MTHMETHGITECTFILKNELLIILYGIVLYLEILSCLSPVSFEFSQSFMLQMFHCNYSYPNNMFFPALVKKNNNYIPFVAIIWYFSLWKLLVFYRAISIQLYSMWRLNNFRITVWMDSLHYFHSNRVVHINVSTSQRCMENLDPETSSKTISAVAVLHFVKSRKGGGRGGE